MNTSTFKSKLIHIVDTAAMAKRFAESMPQSDVLLPAAPSPERGMQLPQDALSDVSDASDRYLPRVGINKSTSPPEHSAFYHGTSPQNALAAVRNVREAHVVTDPACLPDIAAAIQRSGTVALDVETYGPRNGDALDPWRGDIRLLSLAVPGEPPWLLDLRALGYELGVLKGVLENVEILAHYAKFDLLWLRVKCDLQATKVACTLTAARLLAAGTKPGNNLDQCLERYLGIPGGEDHSTSDWGAASLTHRQHAYAGRDVAHLHELMTVLRGLIELEELDLTLDLELQLLPVVVKMEAEGVAVDQERLSGLCCQAQAEACEHAATLRELLGQPGLNPASTQQLRKALQAKGIDLPDTEAETLKEKDDGTIIPVLLAHRGAVKQAQQTASLLKAVRDDGRIHGRFDPTGTVTGRFSSSKPNMQNIPRGEIAGCIKARDGCFLIRVDYAQIELRIAAAISGEERMLEAFRNGVDLHRQTAALLLGKNISTVTPDERQMAKAVNFGMLFGQKAAGLCTSAHSAYGVTLSLEKAEEHIKAFHQAYPTLAAWQRSQNDAADSATEVRTIIYRRCLLPGGRDKRWSRYTALLNTPVQGSAADGLKIALCRLHRELPADCLIVGCIHDEILVEAPSGKAADIQGMVGRVMVEAMESLFPQVRFEVDVKDLDQVARA